MSADHWAPLVPELSCSNFDESLNFYCALIGFQIRFSRPEKKFAYLDLDGAQIMLEQVNDYWSVGELTRPFGRGMNFQITITDVVQLQQRLLDKGTKLFRDLETSWYRQDDIERGVSEFLVQDPDGYLLRFSQFIAVRNHQPS